MTFLRGEDLEDVTSPDYILMADCIYYEEVSVECAGYFVCPEARIPSHCNASACGVFAVKTVIRLHMYVQFRLNIQAYE